MIRRYPTPPRRNGRESDTPEEEEEEEEDDEWDPTRSPRMDMVRQLQRIQKPRHVKAFIRRWSRRAFPSELDERENIIYTCWARQKWKGAAQWPCPFCQAGYQTQQALSRHLEEQHSERLPKDLLSTTLGSIYGKKAFWRIKVDGEEYTSRHLYQCPVSKCPYFSSCKAGYSSHMQRQHESCHELIAKLGPLWGTIVYEARTNNDITTMGQLRKDVKGFECPKCRCYFGQTKKTLAQHCSRVHADTRFEGGTIQPRRFEAWFSLHLDDATYERLQSRLLEDERETLERREAVRTALQASRHEPVLPPQQEENEEREKRRRREEELRRRREADARMAEVLNTPRSSQGQTMGEEMRDSQGETDDDHPRPEDVDVVGRARQWLDQGRAEEQRLETLPPIWGKRLRKATAEIQNLFQTEVSSIREETQRMLDIHLDLDDEERWLLIDGTLARINSKLRWGLKRILRVPRTQTRRVRLRNQSSKVIRSAKKLVDMLRRMYESRRMARTQARLTAESQLAETVEKAMQELEEAGQLVAITDNGEINLEDLMQADREHFENRMQYISDNLQAYEREVLGKESSSYRSMLQSMYNEDPNRVLKHFVFRDNHEECTLTMQQLVETYGTSTSTMVRYDPDEEFGITRRLEEEDSELIWDYISDPDNIKEVLRTRSNLSAQGPDSVPYSVWKAGGDTTVELIRWITAKMREFHRFPTLWKDAKTVFIPKDGNLREPRNWRPITITSTLYRIFMCLMSRAFQMLNSSKRYINNAQHGFMKTPNGAMTHIAVVNELIKHADRAKSSMYVMSIDLRDAFGSVSHDLIAHTLRAKGFSEDLVTMIMDSYQGATTRYVNGETSQPIFLNRGVRQGCPLAPTLFNLCVEGLLEKLTKQEADGFEVGNKRITVQAYADDILLISDTEQGLKNLASTLERFCAATNLTINVDKCRTMSYIVTANRRTTADVTFELRGQPVKTVSLTDYMEYLGCPIAVTKEAKMEHARGRILEVLGMVNRVRMSHLTFVQTLDSLKRFIIPKLDYELANGVCPKGELEMLDQQMRCALQDLLGKQSMPTEFFYTAWKDGGLGLPKLVERWSVLQIRTFLNMLQAPDGTVREVVRTCVLDEARCRGLPLRGEDPREVLQTPLPYEARGYTGTSNLLARFLKAQTDIGVKIVPRENNEEEERREEESQSEEDRRETETYDWILKPLDEDEGEGVRSTDADLTKKLTRMIRDRYQKALTTHPLRGHSFIALKNCPISSYFLATGNTRPKDNLVKFAILARTNSLHTGQIRRLANRNVEDDGLCCCGQLESLSHILNGCQFLKQRYTDRHNRVVDLVWDMINKANHPAQLHPHFNTIVPGPLSEVTRRLRPDIWYMRNGVLHVVEITVPYASTTQRDGSRQDTLAMRRTQKLDKYQQLIEEIQNQPGAAAELHVIIVGSLGAIPDATMKELLKLAPAPLAKRYAKRIVAATILGSRILYLGSQKRGNHRGETHRASGDTEAAPATSSSSDVERYGGERGREELDRQNEELAPPHPARDDSDFSSSDTDSVTDSIDSQATPEAESSSDDGSVVYWNRQQSRQTPGSLSNAGMQ